MNTRRKLFLVFFILCCTFINNVYSVETCERKTFFFKLKPQKCFNWSLEKNLFSKLKITETNTHDEVLKFWLQNYNLLKGKKFTLLHIDSRKKKIFFFFFFETNLKKMLILILLKR